jgi:ABC-type phosphate transport system substrate-binding protein
LRLKIPELITLRISINRLRFAHRRNRLAQPHILRITSYQLLFLLVLSGCTSPTLTPRPTPALVRVAVSDVTQPLLLDLAASYAAANPDVVVAPSLAPEAALPAQLASGEADLTLTIAPDPKLFATPIGQVPFQFVVHPKNEVTGLTLAQAQALLSGRFADWSQVGGAPGPVQIVDRGPGTADERALGLTAFGPLTVTTRALVAPTWAAMRQLVAQNPAALGYLIRPEIDASVKPIALLDAAGQPLPLRLLAVAQAASSPTGAARAFLAWAQSPAGQTAAGKRNEKLGK